jgi:hypothetical protein
VSPWKRHRRTVLVRCSSDCTIGVITHVGILHDLDALHSITAVVCWIQPTENESLHHVHRPAGHAVARRWCLVAPLVHVRRSPGPTSYSPGRHDQHCMNCPLHLPRLQRCCCQRERERAALPVLQPCRCAPGHKRRRMTSCALRN